MIMSTVIVTVKSANTLGKDYEIPLEMSATNIIRSLAEALKLPANTAAVTYRIMAQPPGRYLSPEESLAEAGVWDGAVLNITK